MNLHYLPFAFQCLCIYSLFASSDGSLLTIVIWKQWYILYKRTVPVSGGSSPLRFCAASPRLLAGAIDYGQVKTPFYVSLISYSKWIGMVSNCLFVKRGYRAVMPVTLVIAPSPLIATNFILLDRFIRRFGSQYSRLTPKRWEWYNLIPSIARCWTSNWLEHRHHYIRILCDSVSTLCFHQSATFFTTAQDIFSLGVLGLGGGIASATETSKSQVKLVHMLLS